MDITTSTMPETQSTKKKNPIVGCVLLVVLITGVLLVLVGGMAWYGWQFDKEIPLVSRPVRYALASVGEPKATAQVIQEHLNATLVNTLYPAIEANPELKNKIASSPQTQEYLDELKGNYQPIKTLRVSIRADVKDTKDWSGDLTLTGAGNTNDPQDSRAQIGVDLNVVVGGQKYGGAGEVRFIKKRIYAKLDRIEGTEEAGVSLKYVLGQWYHYEADDAAETAQAVTGQSGDIDESTVVAWSQFLQDRRILKNPQRMPDRTFNGEAAYCLQLSWNKDELAESLRIYNENARAEGSQDTMSEEDIGRMVEDVKLTTLNVCTGKQTHRLYHAANTTELTGDAAGTYTFELGMTDHNQPINIEEPQDSKDIAEVLESLGFSATSGYSSAELPADVPLFTSGEHQLYQYKSDDEFYAVQVIPNQTSVVAVTSYLRTTLGKGGWTVAKADPATNDGKITAEIKATKGQRRLTYMLFFNDNAVQIQLAATKK